MKYNDYRTGKADVLLCNSFYDLEKHVIDAVRKEVIGTPGVEVSFSTHVSSLYIHQINVAQLFPYCCTNIPDHTLLVTNAVLSSQCNS